MIRVTTTVTIIFNFSLPLHTILDLLLNFYHLVSQQHELYCVE
jgi:hypothetical protein